MNSFSRGKPTPLTYRQAFESKWRRVEPIAFRLHHRLSALGQRFQVKIDAPRGFQWKHGRDVFDVHLRDKMPKSFRLIAYSDSQWNPSVHRHIVDNGIKPLLEDAIGVDAVLIAGDLVHIGADAPEYMTKFLSPLASIADRTPIIPALGNHEYQGLEDGESPPILSLLSPPQSASSTYPGHWHAIDHHNTRIISLNSNLGAKIRYRHHPEMYNEAAAAEQYRWFQATLAEICDHSDLDFAIVQFHHPGKNELWSSGNELYSERLTKSVGIELSKCNKGGVVLNGHQHAYSRGQDPDYPVYWVTVASAGGRLDFWGDYENTDYPEYTHSWPTFGFVSLHVEKSGELHIQRFDVGDDKDLIQAPTLADSFQLRVENHRPNRPVLRIIRNDDELDFDSSGFSDDDGDSHFASHWRCVNELGVIALDERRHSTNFYRGSDTQAGMSLTKITFKPSTPTQSCQVRYRDSALAWSQWSAPAVTN